MIITAPAYQAPHAATAGGPRRSPFGAVMPHKADGSKLETVDSYFPSRSKPSSRATQETGLASGVGAAAGATPGFPLQLILLGPPGSGKSTQAQRLAEKYDVPHISVGTLLRDEMDRGTELGEKVRSFVESGDLAPSELVSQVLMERLSQPDTEGGFIIDGYPREMAQLPVFEKLLSDKSVTNLQVLGIEVSDDEVKTRLCSRGRVDDTPAVVEHRLDIFREDTAPVVDYFINQGMYFVVDGCGSVEEVQARIEECAMPSYATP